MLSQPSMILAAMYSVPMSDGTAKQVCLGIRISNKEDIARMSRLLLNQVRQRYESLFIGMKPREIASIVNIHTYSIEPDKHGFPKLLGESFWYNDSFSSADPSIKKAINT